jgi:membrane protein
VLIGKLREQSFLLGLVAVVATAAIPAALWLLVTWYLPHRATSWTELVPGAVLFGVGVLALHVITIYWIAREMESKTSTYGAIGAALALLLWAYLLGRVMAAGAVLNMALWEQRHEGDASTTEH